MTHRFQQHATHFTVAASEMVTRYQQLDPSPPPSSESRKMPCRHPSAHRPAAFVFPHYSKHQHPERRTPHVSSPKRGASACWPTPRAGKQVRPSVFRSRRPTDCHLPCRRAGAVCEIRWVGFEDRHRSRLRPPACGGKRSRALGWVDAITDRLAIDLDLITKLDALTNVSGLLRPKSALPESVVPFQGANPDPPGPTPCAIWGF